METAVARRSDLASSKHKSILLVEDDSSLEGIWHLIAHNLNYECKLDWVTSGRAAERVISEKRNLGEPYDVILCDIFLSGSKTGIDLVHDLAAEPCEFVFTSGVSAEKLQKFLAREPRTFRVLHKPLDPNLCIKTLNEILDDREQLK
jgi:CheY-like chemotaxis protein